MGEITVEQLRAHVEQLKSLSDQIDSASEILKGLNKQYDELSAKIMEALEKNGLENFKVPGLLTVYTVDRYSFKQPMGQENEEAFNAWLEQENLSHLRKLNSNTLNSELNQRRKKAEETGELFMPPPGIEAPTIIKQLNARKA